MQITRRKATILSGGLVSGGIVFNQFSSNANAEVSMSGLSIPDESAGITGDVSEIILQVTGEYSFDSSTQPDECILRVVAGTSQDTMDTVKGTRISPSGSSDSGSETITASLLGVNGITSDLFGADPGKTASETLYIGLEFEVNKNGETITKDSVVTETMLSITNEEITISTDLGGVGVITVN